MPNKDESTDKKATKRRPKPYVELMIEVKGRGQYEDVKRFITDLQQFPKILAVKTVSLSPKNEPGSREAFALDVTLELKAHLFPPENEAGGTDSKVVARR